MGRGPARRELSFALGREDEKIRFILPLRKWEAIAAQAQAVFNERLRSMGLPAGRWAAKGQTPLSRLLGKELVLLAWAIEDADPGLIPRAIQNWQGLAPEERWWLFTMTNAATGHAITGRDRGWRKAVRYALTENPVCDEGYLTRPVQKDNQCRQRSTLTSWCFHCRAGRRRGRICGPGVRECALRWCPHR